MKPAFWLRSVLMFPAPGVDCRQQQLSVIREWRGNGVSGNSTALDRQWRDVQRSRYPVERQGMRDRKNHCRQSFPRWRRSCRTHCPVQQNTVPCSRRTEIQGIQLYGYGPGRHRTGTLHHRDEASAGTDLSARYLRFCPFRKT